nr:(-)-isopiperitenol/(-)-carveol dehydrogenase, mitochondrial-like isoform X2 [Coffea arabica]
MTEPASTLATKKLEGKVAIVTGGASGIGEATAHLFAENGVKAVVVADIQDDKGRLVTESIGSHQCSYFHCDVSDENQVKALVEWTVQTYGQLDIMFSNASIHAARVMVEQGVKGNIVCTTSVAASRGGVSRTDYIMAKHAVLGLVRCGSQQLGVHGIRVNSVSPSAIATPLTSTCVRRTRGKDIGKVYGPLTSLKGIALTVRHVAEAVLFLVSQDSAFITGHDLSVDGGLISLPGPNN